MEKVNRSNIQVEISILPKIKKMILEFERSQEPERESEKNGTFFQNASFDKGNFRTYANGS